jgi:hypothetical protein
MALHFSGKRVVVGNTPIPTRSSPHQYYGVHCTPFSVSVRAPGWVQ